MTGIWELYQQKPGWRVALSDDKGRELTLNFDLANGAARLGLKDLLER